MEMHWVLTLELPGRGALTRNGVVSPRQGDSRAVVYDKVRESLVRDFPHMANANTAFWSLEPNQL